MDAPTLVAAVVCALCAGFAAYLLVGDRRRSPAGAAEAGAEMVRSALEMDWLEAAGASHPGARAENQDRLLLIPSTGSRGALAVVADGLGGYSGGSLAASAAIETLREMAEMTLHEDPAWRHQLMASLFLRAHGAILEKARREPSLHGMGTTVVAALVARDGLCLHLYAGDSRLYLVRGGSVLYRTFDHTAAQDLVAAGRLRPDKAEGHPLRAKLTSSLGDPASPSFRVEPAWLDGVAPESQPCLLRLAPGDTLLLCSDGLTSAMEDGALAGLVSQGGASSRAESLVSAALRAGADDNVTAVVLVYRGMPLTPTP